MKNFEIYLSPRMKELHALGYYPKMTSKEVQSIVLEAMLSDKSPLKEHIEWYISEYGNFVMPTRAVVCALAYGLTHLNEFGGAEDRVAYDAFTHAKRFIMFRYHRFGADKVKNIRLNRVFMQGFTDKVLDQRVVLEALDQARRALGEEVKWRWDKRDESKKKKARVKHAESYLMRLASKYE